MGRKSVNAISADTDVSPESENNQASTPAAKYGWLPGRSVAGGGPGRARTNAQPVMIRLLYH